MILVADTSALIVLGTFHSGETEAMVLYKQINSLEKSELYLDKQLINNVLELAGEAKQQ